MADYRNPWHSPAHPNQGPRVYHTDARPIEYRGYLIYQRIPGVVWDVATYMERLGHATLAERIRAAATDLAAEWAAKSGLAAAAMAGAGIVYTLWMLGRE